MRRKYNHKYGYKSLKPIIAISLVIILIVVFGTLAYPKISAKNPLPADIKNQVTFKVVYPSTKAAPIDTSTYNFQPQQNSLNFNVKFAGSNVIFTEQPSPPSLGEDSQPYYPALGIHAYAQFKTKLGMVVLTKFWQSGTFKPLGQSAVLSSKGTLLIAHSSNALTNEQWKSLFDSLKITQ